MTRTGPGVTRYTAYWAGHGETTQTGVAMLFAALRRGWPWVHRVAGDIRVILHPGRIPVVACLSEDKK